MRIKTLITIVEMALIAAAIVALRYMGESMEIVTDQPETPPVLKCALQIGKFERETKGFVNGYNYELLESFADSADLHIDIFTARSGENCIDSVKSGAFDILVLPLIDTAGRDSTIADSLLRQMELREELACSIPIDSLTVWAVDRSNRALLEYMNAWIGNYLSSPEHESKRSRFMDTFNNPYNVAKANIHRSHLSPYDETIRFYADSLQWDWRLLAALMYKESKFHIEVQSSKGAQGLMQLISSTAERYNAENLLNPKDNIRAGTEHLMRLQKRFWRKVDSSQERRLIAIAAYNAGEWHISDAIAYAESLEKFDGTWASIAEVLPDMSVSDSSVQIDTVNIMTHGRFKVDETLDYVESICDLYDVFTQICPR